MTPWHRRSISGKLENLARKARRRGDSAEAVRWLRAITILQTAEERHHLAAERRWKFNNDRKKWESMEDELRRLRTHYRENPR